MYALWIENTSETDPRSYEATKAVTMKAQKEFRCFNGIRSHDLCDTDYRYDDIPTELWSLAGSR